MDIASFANDILDLVEENRALRSKVHELKAFKQAYWDEVAASRKHGEAMIAGMLDLCLVPGVMTAIEDARS
jgi:hypothetical protein